MKNNKTVEKFLIKDTASIKEAMRIIDRASFGIAFVVNKYRKINGVVTDGDIRRAVITGLNINRPVMEIVNKNPIAIKEGYSAETLAMLKSNKIIREKIPLEGSLKIPVIDKKGKIKDVLFLYADNRIARGFTTLSKTDKNIKSVLIVGGAGYLGSVLCRKLLSRGYKVRILDNMTYGDDGLKELYEKKQIEFLKGDIRNISDVMDAIKGIDAVIHLAAIVGDPACQLNSRQTIEINYLATKSLAEACKFHQINRFLFASTCSVYGASKAPNDRLIEESPLNPVSLYAQTKLESEKGIFSIGDENFTPTVFRFATLFGVSPRMRFDLVVNTMTSHAVIDKEITVFGGNQWRPNVDVSDAADACVKWLESPIEKTGNQIFNIGANKLNYQICQIGRIIKKVVPEARLIIKRTDGDKRDYNVSFDKAAKSLRLKIKKTIAISAGEIVELMKENGVNECDAAKYSNYRFLLLGEQEREEIKKPK